MNWVVSIRSAIVFAAAAPVFTKLARYRSLKWSLRPQKPVFLPNDGQAGPI